MLAMNGIRDPMKVVIGMDVNVLSRSISSYTWGWRISGHLYLHFSKISKKMNSDCSSWKAVLAVFLCGDGMVSENNIKRIT